MHVVAKQLIIQGFIVFNPTFGPTYYKQHQETLQNWLADGSIKAKMSFTDGIDHAAEGLVGIFEGQNFGKAVLRLQWGQENPCEVYKNMIRYRLWLEIFDFLFDKLFIQSQSNTCHG